MKSTTIKGLAGAGGVGVETVRYYQRRGLLETPERGGSGRTGGSIRRYTEDHIKQLRFIRSAQAAGFTLEEIGELLILDATDDRKRVHQLATKRLADLDVKISELKDARRALDYLVKECGSSSPGPCPIINAFID